ncbi:MAG: YjcZ family sporulation protein [Bacilli bacterium]|nr:YjcZ family sporulation protein [Bacilli bacterium]
MLGNSFAIILVLFILLVIIGSGCWFNGLGNGGCC